MTATLLTVVGARPQFVKAAVVSRALQAPAIAAGVREVIVHTGQHYDARMSQVFFDELGIPAPTHQLAVGSGSHGKQTAGMLEAIEEVCVAERPDAMLVYGDTNSTLAGALAASKLHIPVLHVEAGLRSFERRMPEEVNRVLTDHVSAELYCPTRTAVANLAAEGITEGVHEVGDVMFDATVQFGKLTAGSCDILAEHGLEHTPFVLMTCHRAENTNDPARFEAILSAAARIAGTTPVVFPVHPRIAARVGEHAIATHPNVRLLEPVSYVEMLALESAAAVLLTDSGGVQKEAFAVGVPCVTMRDQTEWTETIEAGANTLVGADEAAIVTAVAVALARVEPLPAAGPYYGNGEASRRIAERAAAFVGVEIATTQSASPAAKSAA